MLPVFGQEDVPSQRLTTFREAVSGRRGAYDRYGSIDSIRKGPAVRAIARELERLVAAGELEVDWRHLPGGKPPRTFDLEKFLSVAERTHEQDEKAVRFAGDPIGFMLIHAAVADAIADLKPAGSSSMSLPPGPTIEAAVLDAGCRNAVQSMKLLSAFIERHGKWAPAGEATQHGDTDILDSIKTARRRLAKEPTLLRVVDRYEAKAGLGAPDTGRPVVPDLRAKDFEERDRAPSEKELGKMGIGAALAMFDWYEDDPSVAVYVKTAANRWYMDRAVLDGAFATALDRAGKDLRQRIREDEFDPEGDDTDETLSWEMKHALKRPKDVRWAARVKPVLLIREATDMRPRVALDEGQASADRAREAAIAARHFELVEGKSSKFWEISVVGATHTVRFGRIGTAGQSKTKTFDNDALARKDADLLIAEKTKKGYVEK